MFRIGRRTRGSRQAIELLSRGVADAGLNPGTEVSMPEVVRTRAFRERKENG